MNEIQLKFKNDNNKKYNIDSISNNAVYAKILLFYFVKSNLKKKNI